MFDPEAGVPGGGLRLRRLAPVKAGEAPSAYRFVGLGFELILPVILGAYVGHRLDLWLDSSPWLVLIGAAFGIVTGFVLFFRSVMPSKSPGGGSA